MLEEELMAFVDGELEISHAERIELHLQECSDCARVVAESRTLSQQLSKWKVEEPPLGMTKTVSTALESREPRRSSWLPEWWIRNRALGYGLCGAFAIVVLVAISVLRDQSRNEAAIGGVAARTSSGARSAANILPPPPAGPPPPQDIKKIITGQGQGQGQQQGQPELQKHFALEQVGTLGRLQATSLETPTGPMIIRSNQLTLISRNFDAARSGIESIVRDSKGYIDQMTVQTNPGIPKSISAVLRIPSDRLDSSLANLRKLGQVKQESQNSTDISGQYVDLVARLNNSRNTEQRLLTLLRERTGNLKDIVAAEGELSRVREEIERMEAQRKNLNNQVQYASVQVEVAEEYHAELQPRVPATGTRFHNAAVEGLDSAAETILGLALAGLSYGPAALVWLVIATVAVFATRWIYLSLKSRRGLRTAGSQ